jgi:spermidine synthase
MSGAPARPLPSITLPPVRPAASMAPYFGFFFLSGFCSILYELVWLRLAMARFGVTTALVSIVLSMFMAGLGIGSLGAGAWLRRRASAIQFPPLRLYALIELLIGVSALMVPLELVWGHRVLQAAATHTVLSSAWFYVIAGACLTLTLVPWCACMGATIPVAMFAIRQNPRYEARRSFSFLYLANVIGAIAGSIIPLFIIEFYGFHRTLRVGAVLNSIIAASAFAMTVLAPSLPSQTASRPAAATQPIQQRGILLLLFCTGLVTMGMEIVWVRLFTSYLGGVVYSFAAILASYLCGTFAGSQAYRFWSRTHRIESRLAWISLALLGMLPILTSDSRFTLGPLSRVLLGIIPFAAMMGFLTPMLVDRWSAGDPDRAGRAYAVNVVGCILGPLLAGFILLPFVSERLTALLLALPWLALAWPRRGRPAMALWERAVTVGVALASLAAYLATRNYEEQFGKHETLRDSTATVVAYGVGLQKHLLVNGISMTTLSPITKMMAHFALASLDHPPQNLLVICFGMGTTFRSALTWGVPVTSVDLVPSVPKLFHYFHADAAQVAGSPLAQIVTDDGRRYLERVPTKYDVIIIDPPPPVQAAGSSLLYSEEFYAVAKQRLQPGGILVQWLPTNGDADMVVSVTEALRNSFPYLRIFHSLEGDGWHFLASERPIPQRSAAELLARMPGEAVADMMEWEPAKTPTAHFDSMLSTETTPEQTIASVPGVPPLQDDRPVNEYYLLRWAASGRIAILRKHW